MAEPIATWYEVNFNENNSTDESIIGAGTTLNFSGVEAGTQSIIKCVRIKFTRKISKLRFWVVNNISGSVTNGGVFDDGWGHGYHIRQGDSLSPLLNANNNKLFDSSYYEKVPTGNVTKVPFGYEEYAGSSNESTNYNSFVYLPRDTKFFTNFPDYTQWGETNKNGDFEEGTYTPYIYLVVNPPLSADGGSRTGWGYRISFLYS